MSFDGLLVIAFGGPHKPEDIRPFLRDVLAGRPVPPGRVEEVAAHYEAVGGRSPITEHTEAQARALEEALRARGVTLPARVGMRHWTPRIAEALRAFAGEGRRRLLGLIMAAQETEASQARYAAAVDAARASLGADAPTVRFVAGWGGSQGFVDANAERVRARLDALPEDARTQASLLFTAHSIPRALADGSPYVGQLEATARRVAEQLGHPRYRLVYQSRSGNPREPWLEPDILDALREEHAAGVRDVVVAPIGFVCDHVEVLYDLDREARSLAENLGLGFHRAATVGDHPAYISCLADAVQAALDA